MNNTKIARLRILNEKGLHARAAAKFVELVDKFDVNVVVKKDSLEASGDSIMGLLMLGASKAVRLNYFVWKAISGYTQSSIKFS